MFDVSGYISLSSQKSCLRQCLYQRFGIKSAACLHCTNCKKRNHINISAATSKNALSQEELNRNIVITAVSQMLHVCFVCKQKSCDGQQCWPTNQSRCYACHCQLTKSNFHNRPDCMATKPEINTHSQSCPLCCLALSELIQCRGSKADHQPKRCPHKNRLKRVLLFKVEDSMDRGDMARRVLSSALSNHDHWFATMASNIASINVRRSK